MYIVVAPGREMLVYFNFETEALKLLQPLKLRKDEDGDYVYNDNSYDFDDYDTDVLVARWVDDPTLKLLSFDVDDMGVDILYRNVEELEMVLDYLYKHCNPMLSTQQVEDELVRENLKQLKTESAWLAACRLVRSVNYYMLKNVILRLDRIASYFNI